MSRASGLPQKAAGLVSLLGNKIVSVLSKGGKMLEIRFTNKETLKVYDSNTIYGSFQVTTRDIEIVVKTTLVPLIQDRYYRTTGAGRGRSFSLQ